MNEKLRKKSPPEKVCSGHQNYASNKSAPKKNNLSSSLCTPMKTQTVRGGKKYFENKSILSAEINGLFVNGRASKSKMGGKDLEAQGQYKFSAQRKNIFNFFQSLKCDEQQQHEVKALSKQNTDQPHLNMTQSQIMSVSYRK